MTDGTRPALVADALSVARGRRTVVHGVDLAVSPGETVAVLGPNGSGKSTLLAALQGTLGAASGTVTRHGRVATVMQSPGLARRSARANVEVAMAWWGVPRAQRRSRATEALERMRAGHLAGRNARTLSGGEQRRVHLARAVAVAPDVLLLDEPFGGLDPETHASVRDDTLAALRATGGAVVVVLHDRADAWAMADRLVVLLDGRITADGPPQAVLDAPPSAEVARFLGYDGELTDGAGVLLTRARHVRLDDAGDRHGTVTQVVPVEDGARVHLATADGDVWAHGDGRLVAVGAGARFRVDGGARYPRPPIPTRVQP